METKTFNGHKYESDGKSVWKDGVLLDIQVPEQIKSVQQVEALKVDDTLFYNDALYKKMPTLQESHPPRKER